MPGPAGLLPTPALAHAERSRGGPTLLAPRASSLFPRCARPGLPLPRAVSSAVCLAAGGALPFFGAAAPRGSVAARRLRAAPGSKVPRAAALLSRPSGAAAPGSRLPLPYRCRGPALPRAPTPSPRPRAPWGSAPLCRVCPRAGPRRAASPVGEWRPSGTGGTLAAAEAPRVTGCAVSDRSGERGSAMGVAGDPSLSLLKLLLGRAGRGIWLLWKHLLTREGAEAAARLSGRGQTFPAQPLRALHIPSSHGPQSTALAAVTAGL